MIGQGQIIGIDTCVLLTSAASIRLEAEEDKKIATTHKEEKVKESLPFDDPVCITLDYFRYGDTSTKEIKAVFVLFCSKSTWTNSSERINIFLSSNERFNCRKSRNCMEKEVILKFV